MRRARLGASCLLLGFALPFCGRAETTPADRSGGAGGMADGGAGAAVNPTPLGGSAGAEDPTPPDAGAGPTCTPELHALARPHAALLLLLDSSGAMFEPVANGRSRIEGVVEGLTRFAEDPESGDLSVGIQYFPIRRADVPAECRTHEDCGPGGPCVGTCLGSMSAGQPILCTEDAHCGGTPCVLNGELSICSDEYSCDPAVYAEPAVPIESLTENAPALTDSIEAQLPLGSRPAGPALEAAIAHARAYSEENAGRSTAVLLVTEGESIGCGDTNERVAAVVSEGVSGTPVVKTFAIGVTGFLFPWVTEFLGAVAEAGGTDTAAIISAEEDVPTSLLGMLREIRAAMLSCAFELPERASGDQLDPDVVSVEITDENSEAELVPRVSSEGDCGPPGGWHFDSDRAPRSIVLCPATCRDLLARPTAGLGVRLECAARDVTLP